MRVEGWFNRPQNHQNTLQHSLSPNYSLLSRIFCNFFHWRVCVGYELCIFVVPLIEGHIILWETIQKTTISQSWVRNAHWKEKRTSLHASEREGDMWPEFHQSDHGIAVQQHYRGSRDLGYLRHATDRPLPRRSPLQERQTPELSTIWLVPRRHYNNHF